MYVERPVPNPEEVVFMSSFCSEDAAYSVFNEVPFVDVSWDAMSTDPIVHEGLLQQLAQGTEEEMQCEQHWRHQSCLRKCIKVERT